MTPVTRPEQVLMNADVQKELGLDDEQRAKLAVLLAPYMKAHRIAMQGFPTTFAQMSEEEQREHREVIRNPLPANRLRDVLDDRQYRRMEEILFQAKGHMAINHPKVAAQLQLTTEQKAKINAVHAAVWKVMSTCAYAAGKRRNQATGPAEGTRGANCLRTMPLR